MPNSRAWELPRESHHHTDGETGELSPLRREKEKSEEITLIQKCLRDSLWNARNQKCDIFLHCEGKIDSSLWCKREKRWNVDWLAHCWHIVVVFTATRHFDIDSLFTLLVNREMIVVRSSVWEYFFLFSMERISRSTQMAIWDFSLTLLLLGCWVKAPFQLIHLSHSATESEWVCGDNNKSASAEKKSSEQKKNI